MNYITIHGYLGRDPEIKDKFGQDNKPYKRATFSVGVSRSYGDQTDWFYCVINGKRAEVIGKYFHKGSQILIHGRMESYKAKDSDQTRWILNITDFDFCDKSSGGGQSHPAQQSASADTFEDIDEDVPF